MTSALAAARLAVWRGWFPFPLDHPDLPSCIGLHGRTDPCDGTRGKHPAVAWGTATAVMPPDRLLQTWFDGAARNVGIACKPSGLLVIDEDRPDALTELATSLNQITPPTYRVRTRRGWHWYFRADPARPLGNSAGALAEHGIDVRGGGGKHGGYVVAEGSVHQSGHVYEAEDWEAAPAPLPDWIAELITCRDRNSRRPVPRLRNARRPGTYPAGWDDAPRTGTAGELLAQYRRHLAEVATPGGEFRHELYLAALDGWRLVNVGLLDEHDLLTDLAVAVNRVWRAPPDERDDQIVHVEAKEKAATSPWVVVAETDRRDDAGGGQSDGSTDDPYTLALAAEVRKERLRRDARAVLAVEAVPPLRRLSGAAFLAAPQPVHLVPGLLYRDSLAQVYGAPGSGKSFLALDVALCLAHGMPWGGRPGEESSGPGIPRHVHFVMAEGQAVNVARTHAWLATRSLTELAETFVAFPSAVMLTEQGIGRYLAEVETDRPALIVLDTKNAMIAGNESDPTDVAEMVRAMHALRAVCGSCVLLVDHSGVRDPTRSRGSNALPGGVDTIHRVVRDRQTGIIDVWCDRDKAGYADYRVGEFRLRAVDPAVVLEPLTEEQRDAVIPFGLADGWWIHDPEDVPDEVAQLTGKGRHAARDVYRVLRYVGDPDGITVTQIRAALDEHPDRQHGRSAYFAALALLKEEGITVIGSTPARVALR